MSPEQSGISTRLSSRGGPAVSLSASQISLARSIAEQIRHGTLAMASSSCPCGAGPRDVPFAEIDRYGIPMRSVVCLQCGTVRFDPYFSATSLEQFYTDYYQELYERSSNAEAYFKGQRTYGMRVADAIRAHAPNTSKVIEVGCGAGGALAVLREEGMTVAGCDHSERLIRFGTSQAIGPLIAGDLAELMSAVPDFGRADVVYLHHVFEHLSAPHDFLRSCEPVLNASGMVIAIVPDIARIDSFPFPGGDVRLFLHVAHKFNYSREGLRRIACNCGYSVRFLEGLDSTVAPELWVAFRPRSAVTRAESDDESGQQMLHYLRRTERRYRLGLLPGYQQGLLARVRRLAATLQRPG